jgi:hypothetical protein
MKKNVKHRNIRNTSEYGRAFCEYRIVGYEKQITAATRIPVTLSRYSFPTKYAAGMARVPTIIAGNLIEKFDISPNRTENQWARI